MRGWGFSIWGDGGPEKNGLLWSSILESRYPAQTLLEAVERVIRHWKSGPKYGSPAEFKRAEIHGPDGEKFEFENLEDLERVKKLESFV